MLKYIIPLLVIYFIYIYDKPFGFIKLDKSSNIRDELNNNQNESTNNKYINMLIEKNMLIFLVSVISSLLIWTNKKEDTVFVIALILINLTAWVRIMKYNKYNTNTNDDANTNESFISSVRKPMYDAYINEESRKQFEADFLNECYDKKVLLTDFEPITKPEEVSKEDAEIRETTIDLALNSDDMFSIQQAENKCIIANYIPDNLEMISDNTFDFDINPTIEKTKISLNNK